MAQVLSICQIYEDNRTEAKQYNYKCIASGNKQMNEKVLHSISMNHQQKKLCEVIYLKPL